MEENNDQTNDQSNHQNIIPLTGARIGFPACILRSNVESAQAWTNVFMPPVYRPPFTKGKEKESTEKQDTDDGIPGGILNDKDLIHVLKDDEKPDMYTHRLSYNTVTNAYYENGRLDREYIKTWKKGVLLWDNIDYKREYDWNIVDSYKDVTSLVEGQYGFVLHASLSGGLHTNISWQRTQLFRTPVDNSGVVDDDSGVSFGLDVRVELIPDLVCEPLPEIEYSKEGKGKELIINDNDTSDFVVHLKIPESLEDNDHVTPNKEIRDFHVHRNVLSARSDYFKALFDSHMTESRENSVTLTDISLNSLEIILKFIYDGSLPDINSYDEWVELLHGASRFLIPALIQRCEKSIREYVNNESVETIEALANECGANQLLRCCKMLEVEDEEVTHDNRSTA
ncbi:14142_t:CDS:2 [Acaulospora colombiana]|uniref:14142_t:CDS:1 n=1 Tax=Acaulospora colombiana TaxID=27376 RepID=A0ACA9L3L3_9GLOM|nr:14142_t:CDS:2 [Acaulospora colombiana]